MTPTEIEAIAEALAPRVAKLLTVPVADAVHARLQPHVRAVLESQRVTAEMTTKALGAIAVREEEGARRKQAMVDAAATLATELHRATAATDEKIGALTAEVRGVTTALALAHKAGPARVEPEPPAPSPQPDADPDEPLHPKTTAAVDELGEEAVTLLTAAIRGAKRAPARLYGWAEWVWTHPAEVQDALKRAGVAAAKLSWAWTRAILLIGGAIGALRVLAPHIPGLEPVADFLQVVMDAASAFDTGAEVDPTSDAEVPAEVAP